MKGRWIFLILTPTVGIAGTVVYMLYFLDLPAGTPATYGMARFLFYSLSAIGVIFSALLSSFNALEAAGIYREKMAFDRTENSFGFLDRFDSASLKEARDMTRQLKEERENLSNAELRKKIDDSPDLKRSVITMFNYYEEILLSLRHNRATEDVLKDALREVFLDMYSRFEPWLVVAFKDSSTLSNLKDLKQRWG